MKTAIIYHYFELNKSYKENFVFFLNTAIFDDAYYFIYISGNCSVKLPNLSNVKYFFIENKNNDFGAVTEFAKHNDSNAFDVYVFVNSSVRGPFLTTFNEKTWHQIFTSRLSTSIALVGSSINLLPEKSYHSIKFGERHKFRPPFIHVQTTAYALSSIGFKLLAQKGFFNQYKKLEKDDVISDYEIQMSQIIMENGFSISSLLPTFEEFNIARKVVDFPNTLRDGDPLFKSAFYGRSLSPFECIFIKTNRDIISERELCSYTFTGLSTIQDKSSLDYDGLELLKNMSDRLATEVIELTIEQVLQQGVAAHREGKLEEAERLYRAIIKSQPSHPHANHNLGILAVSVNKVNAALPFFKAALESNPKIEQFWLSYIDVLIKEKQFENAKQVIEQGKMQGLAGEKLNVLEAALK